MSENLYCMPYTVALKPILMNFDKNMKRFCPKCKCEKTISLSWDLINAYGCFDGSYAIQLECGHILNSWEQTKK